MINIKNLNKSFEKNHVLKDVSMNINQGEKIVIMGPSGCGKSTLLRILATLENFNSGEILIDEAPLQKIIPITQKLSMVFQSFNLFPHMSVLENLIFAPVKIHKKNKEEMTKKALKLLDTFSLMAQKDQSPKTLSGGQKQRVAIMRAMMLETPILLFDEPTSALDPEMTKEVLNSMELLAKSNQTILCVTHEVSFARKFADKIAFFHNGDLIKFEKTDDFFKSNHDLIQGFL